MNDTDWEILNRPWPQFIDLLTPQNPFTLYSETHHCTLPEISHTITTTQLPAVVQEAFQDGTDLAPGFPSATPPRTLPPPLPAFPASRMSENSSQQQIIVEERSRTAQRSRKVNQARLSARYPGESVLRLDLPPASSSINSRPSRKSACRCLHVGQKKARHWATACPSNPNRSEFKCRRCSEMFTRKDNLNKHTKKFHGGSV